MTKMSARVKISKRKYTKAEAKKSQKDTGLLRSASLLSLEPLL